MSARADEMALPADPAAAAVLAVTGWPLGQLGLDAVAAMAAAVPITECRQRAAAQSRRLKGAWASVLRIRREAMAGILPAAVTPAKSALSAQSAAEALGLTYALAGALASLLRAHQTPDRNVAIERLDETLAALTTAIHVRDSVAYPERN